MHVSISKSLYIFWDNFTYLTKIFLDQKCSHHKPSVQNLMAFFWTESQGGLRSPVLEIANCGNHGCGVVLDDTASFKKMNISFNDYSGF